MNKKQFCYELMVQDFISSAHYLRHYKGKCEKLHGHNWKIQIFVKVNKLDKIGLGIDFTKLKKIIHKELNKLDHAFINEHPYFKKVNPSSENIAKFLFDTVSKKLNGNNVKLYKVTVWESEKTCASYIEQITDYTG